MVAITDEIIGVFQLLGHVTVELPSTHPKVYAYGPPQKCMPNIVQHLVLKNYCCYNCDAHISDGLECAEMASSDGYVGDNVFDLKQDIVRFSCRMNYTGNLHPVLDWFQGQSTEAVSSDTTWDPSSNVLSSEVALVATSNLNGIPVKCKARLTTNDVLQEAVQTAQVAWTSKPIYVKCKNCFT